eukprot:4267255-Amphidinium_carterae.1
MEVLCDESFTQMLNCCTSLPKLSTRKFISKKVERTHCFGFEFVQPETSVPKVLCASKHKWLQTLPDRTRLNVLSYHSFHRERYMDARLVDDVIWRTHEGKMSLEINRLPPRHSIAHDEDRTRER